MYLKFRAIIQRLQKLFYTIFYYFKNQRIPEKFEFYFIQPKYPFPRAYDL